MNIFKDALSIFSKSAINSMELYSMRDKILYWNESSNYPSYNIIPDAISLSSTFWTRIKDIHRYTTGDGYERAVTVWWADIEFVITDYVKGSSDSVNIPKQLINVMYKPTTRRDYAERIVTVNGKVYSRHSIAWTKVKKNLQVQYLFNLHTHPCVQGEYSFFSLTDINTFLSSNTAITGLITDKLWLIFKTSATPKSIQNANELEFSPSYFKNNYYFKVYCAEFGKKLYCVDILK
ncbi:hypothetical protein JW887_05030 [Candidatus Dojkabacteria bacterium]|nr:hypothetical protein [Candidatus Dojkabacteria bacterium]